MLGALVRNYLRDDPVTSIFKGRQFAELLTRQVGSRLGVRLTDDVSQIEALNRLRDQGINPQVLDVLHEIGKVGNRATHGLSGDHDTALKQ